MPIRLKSITNAPTVTERGYKEVALYSNILFVGPRDLPSKAEAKLGKAIVIAAKDPMFKDLVENKLLMEVVYIGGKDMPSFAETKKQLAEVLINRYLEK